MAFDFDRMQSFVVSETRQVLRVVFEIRLKREDQDRFGIYKCNHLIGCGYPTSSSEWHNEVDVLWKLDR